MPERRHHSSVVRRSADGLHPKQNEVIHEATPLERAHSFGRARAAVEQLEGDAEAFGRSRVREALSLAKGCGEPIVVHDQRPGAHEPIAKEPAQRLARRDV